MEIPSKVSGEIPEITVLLSDKFGTVYKPFHCVVCGNIVFEYNEDNIRSIIPSGRPILGKAGKIYRCSGVITIHGTGQLYDILYQVMEASFNLETINEIRSTIALLSQASENKFNTRCKARYYIS